MNDVSRGPVKSENGPQQSEYGRVIQARGSEHRTSEPLNKPQPLPGLTQASDHCTSGASKYSALIQLDEAQIEEILQSAPGGASNVQDIYPLSSLQEGMLFHRLVNERTDTYVLSTLLELQSRAQVDALILALQKVMDRHDVLRSAVLWERLPRPVQVVYREAVLPVEFVRLDARRNVVEQMQERTLPVGELFDLRQAPLLRLQLAADSCSSCWYALLQVHHLICDHQSLRLIVSEAIAYLQGRGRELLAPMQFRTHVTQSLAAMDPHVAEAFFREKLAGIDEPTAPFGLMSVHGDGSQIEEVRQQLDPTLAAHVRSGSARYGVSAARLFHAAWALVVARTSGRDDIVFGTVLLASHQRSVCRQRMLGLAVNTLPLRLSLAGLTAKELLDHTHRELVSLLKHESVPLTLAQRCSEITGSAPLFTSLLNYRHTPPDLDVASAEGIRVIGRGEAWTNYPVTMTIDDVGDGFLLMAKADRSAGAERVIEFLRTALMSLLSAMESAPHTLAVALPVLPESERLMVIEQFNATQVPDPSGKLIHQLFEEQVERTPDAVAVTHGGHSCTYAQLNYRANQLARHLRARGVGADERVAICLGRNIEMLVALLGTLKAGGAYVPLDPSNPPERVQHILDDAKPRALLTHRSHASALPATAVEAIGLDCDWHEIDRLSGANLDASSLQLKPEHLAYVIYTSGSTGKPKGVMVEHRSIVNYATYIERQFDVSAGNGSLICTSFSFDLMLTGLYPTLLCGRTVHICSEDQGVPALLGELLRLNSLAPLKLTPSHLPLLEPSLISGELADRVRVLVLGGEPLPAAAARLWKEHAPQTRIFNHYGPTETTVGSVVYEVELPVPDVVPIGRPIANTRGYILNAHLQPVPIGVTGELFIAGAGVARGYFNRPELTAERFMLDPFSTDPRARMYRTGDLARWRLDGTIEYLGRNDDQVKIRGFRIELGEISAQLSRAEQVKQAVVIAREDVRGERRLVAYVVPRDPRQPPTVEVLRAQLRAALPEYMVPAAFISVERIPLTQNGKLDRGALPAPDLAAHVSCSFEAPRDEMELLVADVWRALLGVAQVGRHDNFFELGGHSLAAMQAAARIQAALRVDIPVRALFECPTLQELAEHLEQLQRANLLATVVDGGDEVEQLLDKVASMSDSCVQQLLTDLTSEGRL